jgi:hypothetical protein
VCVCSMHTHTVSHIGDKQELSTRESQGASHISFPEANPSSFIGRHLGKSSAHKNT